MVFLWAENVKALKAKSTGSDWNHSIQEHDNPKNTFLVLHFSEVVFVWYHWDFNGLLCSPMRTCEVVFIFMPVCVHKMQQHRLFNWPAIPLCCCLLMLPVLTLQYCLISAAKYWEMWQVYCPVKDASIEMSLRRRMCIILYNSADTCTVWYYYHPALYASSLSLVYGCPSY